jgi:hypothetical protein
MHVTPTAAESSRGGVGCHRNRRQRHYPPHAGPGRHETHLPVVPLAGRRISAHVPLMSRRPLPSCARRRSRSTCGSTTLPPTSGPPFRSSRRRPAPTPTSSVRSDRGHRPHPGHPDRPDPPRRGHPERRHPTRPGPFGGRPVTPTARAVPVGDNAAVVHGHFWVLNFLNICGGY